MADSAEHWAIVGGGLLGLTLADRLAQAGRRVTLFEAAPELGGLASAWSLGPITWDRHYHVTLLSDEHLRETLRRLQLEDEIQWRETRTGFFTDGQLVSMSNSWEFLRFPPLGLIDKFRLAATIMWASRIRDWRPLEQIPVADWLGKWSGRRTLEKIWMPLLRAKLGDNYQRTSAAFIWATIARMYAARRTGLKKEMFGYVPGGYARVLAAFAERLREAGVDLRLNSPVREVVRDASGWEVRPAAGDVLRCDQVAVTAPSPVVPRLCPGLGDEERLRHDSIAYQGIVCASLLLERPLSPYYVTNITESWVPFTAIIEMTALVSPEEFGGRHLVYLPKYVPSDSPLLEVSDDALREEWLAALERMHPGFSRDDVLAFRVSRVRHVMPLPTLGYSDRLPAMQSTQPGLWTVNSAHIVNGTLNVNETVRLANQAAARMIKTTQSELGATAGLSSSASSYVASTLLAGQSSSSTERTAEVSSLPHDPPDDGGPSHDIAAGQLVARP